MQLRRRKLVGVKLEEVEAAMNAASDPHSLRRAASACPPQDGHGSQTFLYRTASDGSPLYFQSENSISSSASRLSPEALLSMHQQHRAAERSPPLVKSWSDPHLPFSESEKPADQVRGPGGLGPSLQAASMLAQMPKIEEVRQPAMQEAVAHETDSESGQPPTGELMNEFSRALVDNLNRDNDEEHNGPGAGGLLGAGEPEEFVGEDQGSPKAPSRRGPRGTSSKYRGVTRHRYGLFCTVPKMADNILMRRRAGWQPDLKTLVIKTLQLPEPPTELINVCFNSNAVLAGYKLDFPPSGLVSFATMVQRYGG